MIPAGLPLPVPARGDHPSTFLDMRERTLAAYERHARLYVQQWGRRRYRRPRLLDEVLARLPGRAVILDAGSGPGQDLRYLRRRRFRPVGLELAWPFLLAARRRSPTVPLLRGDLRAVPLKPGRLDAIWAAASLIHLTKADVRRTLRAWRTCVRPGGLLAATFVHGERSGIRHDGWIPGRYFSRWHKAELAKAVTRAGWEILALNVVSHRERKGRWVNVLARNPA